MSKFYQALAANDRELKTARPDSPRIHLLKDLRKALEARLPDGSGFDNGTQILEVSDTRIVFETRFHHMNENGYYTRWTHHYVRVKSSFEFDFTIKVTGPNDNDIKNYIEAVFTNLMYEA